ncbi:MAG: hypothetical protein U1E65_18040 [Myxococcota bacterium]
MIRAYASSAQGPFAPGGPLGPPSQAQLQHQKDVQDIRNKVGTELKKNYPDFKMIFKEMGKLSKDEAADFARSLRLHHPELHKKLIHEAASDPDTKATLFADEPALSAKIVEKEAKNLVRSVKDVEPNRTVELMHLIPKNERADVLRQIEKTDPDQIRWLRAVCRDSGDAAMREAFKEFGR